MRTMGLFAAYLLVTFSAAPTCLASSIVLQWDPNTEADLAGYRIYYKANSAELPFDGAGAIEGVAPIDVANQTSATLTGLDPGTDYYFAVTAYNTSGMESSYSNVITVAKVADVTAPSVSLISPTAGTTVSGVVDITAGATDDIGVSRVEFYANSTLLAVSNVAPYRYKWDSTSVSNGTYTILAKAFDAAGNSTSSSVQVAVGNDTTAPTVAITSPSSGSTVTGTASVSVTASDDVNVSKVELYINDALQSTSTTSQLSFSWNTAAFANGSYLLAAKAYDAAGNVGHSQSVTVKLVNDLAAPTITVFAMPPNSTVLSVPLTFSATDDVAVTGYLVSESSSTPAANDSNWRGSAPTSYTFAGYSAHTLYAWAKDAAGNISGSMSASIQISDGNAPTVTSFTMPANATTLTVPVSSLSASDNVAVTGYLLSEATTAPAATDSRWIAGAPASYTFAGYGAHTVYAWAKDAAGNVSAALPAAVTINDVEAPAVTSFSMPASGTSETVPVSSFTATDNVAVAGYQITLSSAVPSSTGTGWSPNAPSSFTFTGEGSYTVYAWVKDAAGNVSSSRTASVTVALADSSAPVITTFSMPAIANATTVSVSNFSATDNKAVTGFMITESATAPAAAATGWSSSAPASFTFAGTGSRTAYAWVKDAAGNISSGSAATVVIDNVAPLMSAPSLNLTGQVLTVAATASDNLAVAKMQLYLDNGLKTEASSSSLSYQLKVGKGSHTVTVKAYDAAGNMTIQTAKITR